MAGAAGIAALALGPPSVAKAASPGSRLTGQRKLIDVSRAMPDIESLPAYIAGIKDQPFDGVTFTLTRTPGISWIEGIQIFAKTKPLTAADFKFDELAKIKWGSLTDNLIWTYTYAEAAGGTNWFDDEMWQSGQLKTKLLAQALNVSGAAGVLLDVEDYGAHTWMYSPTMFPGKSYAQVCAKVRQRGSQFMTELQRGKRDVIVLVLELGFAMRYHLEQNIGHPQDALYATFPSFISGMLDVLKEPATIIDGNEASDYYVDETCQFFGFQDYAEASSYLVDPDVRARYQAIERGSSVYTDVTLGQCAPESWGATRFGYYDSLTSEETQRWFEHNIYHALLKSERYVWTWTEFMDWSKPETRYPGATAGLASAVTKFSNGEPLGFDLSRQQGYMARTTKPTVTTDATFTLSGATSGSRHRKGELLILDATIPAKADIREVVFYDNGYAIRGASSFSPYRIGFTLQAGSHTLVARAFAGDGTHVTTNPIVVTAV